MTACFLYQPVKFYNAKCQPTVYFSDLCISSDQVNMDPLIAIPISFEVQSVTHILYSEWHSAAKIIH